MDARDHFQIIWLTTPLGVNFDLYVAVDGRVPSREDHDFRSRTSDPGEWLELGPDQFDVENDLSLAISAHGGSGEYWVQIRECPTGRDRSTSFSSGVTGGPTGRRRFAANTFDDLVARLISATWSCG